MAALALAACVAWPGAGRADELSVERDPSLEPARAGFFAGSSFRIQRAGFALDVNGVTVIHRVLALTALPGDDLAIRLEVHDPEAAYRLRHGQGDAWLQGPSAWQWRAPDRPGIYAVRVESDAGDFVHLNVLVMHDRGRVEEGVLNGYRIGTYMSEPLRGDPAYLPPEGFVETIPSTEDVLVSPHFTLGQFLCKQPGTPRYLALSVPLVQKLEAILEAVNEAGIDAPSFHVMSGFRTPAYNLSIGNKTVYSRHLWGDAADIYVDADDDGQMDDLNGDGRSDVADARVLFGIVEDLERRNAAFVRDGGLGLYRRNAAHGPFVHVDARGQSARW